MSEKVSIAIWDFHQGKQGVLVDRPKAVGNDNPDIENPIRVEYRPHVEGIFGGVAHSIKAFIKGNEEHLTEATYPAAAVQVIDNPHSDLPHTHDKICVIEEDENGNSDLADRMDREHERSIARAREEANNAKKDLGASEVEKLEKDEQPDEDKRRRRGRRKPDRGKGKLDGLLD